MCCNAVLSHCFCDAFASTGWLNYLDVKMTLNEKQFHRKIWWKKKSEHQNRKNSLSLTRNISYLNLVIKFLSITTKKLQKMVGLVDKAIIMPPLSALIRSEWMRKIQSETLRLIIIKIIDISFSVWHLSWMAQRAFENHRAKTYSNRKANKILWCDSICMSVFDTMSIQSSSSLCGKKLP